MFKFKKKNLIKFAVFVSCLLFIFLLTPRLRAPVINTLKHPLNLLTLIRREMQALIFYHRNYLQNERLKKEIDLLKNKLNASNEIYLENMRLKNLFSFKQRAPLKLIAARVIGRSPDSWSSSIIIDKGKHNGIKPGLAAITCLGLVGRVIEAYESTSKLLLLADPSLGVSAMVQRSRQEGLVCGTLGTHLIMKYLPEEADIRIQDVIVTSGLNQTYPKGLIIGNVIDIGKEFSGLTRYAIIEPAVRLSNIEEVLIVIQ